MAVLRDIIRYICSRYPNKNELSKARLNKIIYLADWTSSVKYGKQLSDVDWYFNHYGPYVNDIVETAHEDECLDVIQTSNLYGDVKEVIKLRPKCEPTWDSLTDKDTEIIDEVIKNTYKLYWNDFIKYVYSTYPIKSQSRFDKLNLVEIANEKDREELHPANK